MKKIIIITVVALLSFVSCQQGANSTVSTKQEVTENARYELFPTENIWTFLKLDTQNGKIWQVQYSIDNNYRGEIELNNKALIPDNAAENGRFTLYPTKNMYNFILLDQIDGKMWQVQWSLEEGNRVVIPMQ